MIEKVQKSKGRTESIQTSFLLCLSLLVATQGCAIPFEPHAAKSSKPVDTSESGSEITAADSIPPEAGPEVIAPDSEINSASWQIQWTSECGKPGGVATQSCAGGYGFTLADSGEFEIGPGPNGQKIRGHITLEDQERIREEISSISKGRGKLPDCEPGELTDGEVPKHFSYFKKDEQYDLRCIVSLKSLFLELAKKYSPAAFPSPCTDAIWELMGLYDSISECDADSDCETLDANFRPTTMGDADPFSLTNCGFVPELKVANGFRAVSWQLELILKREIAKEVCVSSGPVPGCIPGTLRTDQPRRPRCIQRRCAV